MKTYWIVWTYLGNYSKPLEIMADSPEAAAKVPLSFYSDDFRAKASIYVFEAPPVYTYRGPRSSVR